MQAILSRDRYGMTRRTLTRSLLTLGIGCVLAPAVGWASGTRSECNQRIEAGQHLFRRGNIDGAIAEFKAAIAAQPDSSMAHLWLGRALGRKIEKAGPFQAMRMAHDVCHEFEQAVALDPTNTDARSDLMEFYLGAPPMVGGGVEKAEAQAAAIARLDPALGQRARALIEERYDWRRIAHNLLERIRAEGIL